jgi:hypothetical protein
LLKLLSDSQSIDRGLNGPFFVFFVFAGGAIAKWTKKTRCIHLFA